MRSTRLLLLLAVMLPAVAPWMSEPDVDEAAIAHRLIQKLKDHEHPPPSWNLLVRVLESSFLAAAPADDHNDSDVDQGAPHEQEARARALHWLAHDDDAATVLSAESYDRELLPRYALATVYFATGGDAWSRCSRPRRGAAPETACESDEERYLSPHSHLRWDGVHGKRDGQVTWLDLSGRGLASDAFLPLEATVFSPALELLWVSENERLAGTLPDHLREFTSLASLSVYKTSVAGTIPEFLYTDLPKLNSLRLYKSNFSGTISTQIGNLSPLKWLWIHENELTGSVPSEIGQLGKLEGVTLHGNGFHAIPDSLCGLKEQNLNHLWTDCEEEAPVCECCTRCFPRKKRVAVPQ